MCGFPLDAGGVGVGVDTTDLWLSKGFRAGGDI